MSRQRIGDLSRSELRERAYKARVWSKRFAWFGGIWIVVVFFTFIPIPLPFTGPAVVALSVAIPLISFFLAYVRHQAADHYELMARISLDEELGKL